MDILLYNYIIVFMGESVMSNQGIMLKRKTEKNNVCKSELKQELLTISKNVGLTILSGCLKVTSMALANAGQDVNKLINER